MLEMDGVDQLGLSFECLELQFCAEGREVDPDDAITDDNKVCSRPNLVVVAVAVVAAVGVV